jgi:hypothetical protein
MFMANVNKTRTEKELVTYILNEYKKVTAPFFAARPVFSTEYVWNAEETKILAGPFKTRDEAAQVMSKASDEAMRRYNKQVKA